MKLIKVIEISVEGLTGSEQVSESYMLGYRIPKNDEVIEQDEVIEEDEVYLSYFKYEDLGEITEEEIKVLKQFKIIE